MSTPIGKGKGNKGRVSISPAVSNSKERRGKFSLTKTKHVFERHRRPILEKMKQRIQFKRQTRKRTINTLEGEIKKYNAKLALLPEGNEKNKVQNHINAIKDKLSETKSKHNLSKNLNNNYKLPNWFSSSNNETASLGTEPPNDETEPPGTPVVHYGVPEAAAANAPRGPANVGGRRHTRKRHTRR